MVADEVFLWSSVLAGALFLGTLAVGIVWSLREGMRRRARDRMLRRISEGRKKVGVAELVARLNRERAEPRWPVKDQDLVMTAGGESAAVIPLLRRDPLSGEGDAHAASAVGGRPARRAQFRAGNLAC